MKLKAVLIIFILLSFAKADGIIETMSADPLSNSVKITFKTINEDGVVRFIIQKRIGDSGSFDEFAVIPAVGSPSVYTIEDEVVWFKKIMVSVVYYRIAIEMNNGDITYTRIFMAMPNVNEIVKTWGSIKFLFSR